MKYTVTEYIAQYRWYYEVYNIAKETIWFFPSFLLTSLYQRWHILYSLSV